MNEKLPRLKITTDERGIIQAIDTETGQDLAKYATSLVIRVDQSTRFKPMAQIELLYPADIEIGANVEIETTKTYRRLE